MGIKINNTSSSGRLKISGNTGGFKMSSVGLIINGLLLYYDAANTNSYPGSGNTWFDISGNGNNGSLTNGPTFSSVDGGSIVFDGTDDYVDCGNSATVQITSGTISAWVKSTNAGSSYRGIIVKQNNYGLFFLDNILVTYSWGSSGGAKSTGINIADGTWKNTVMTFTNNTGTPSNNAIVYLNGNPVLTTTIGLSGNQVPLTLGSGTNGVSQILNGNIANTQVYSQVLSSSEVLQNYNAQKSRFGL